MKLTILGSGAILSKERNTSAYLLEEGASKVLIDFGSGNLRQLQKICEPDKIASLFLTHVHPDHSLDLISLLAYKKHLKIFKKNPERAQFNLFGPRGTKEFFNNCVKAFPFIERLDFPVKITELEVTKLNHFAFNIKTRPVRHAVECLAYSFESAGKKIVFSGDTEYCEEIVSIAEGADLLVLECSMPDSMQGFAHLSPSECGLVAKRAKPKKLILTHFYPMVEETNILESVRKEFDGEVVLAKDLMELTV